MSWSGYSERGQGSQERGPSTFSLQLPGGVQRMAPRPSAEGGVRVGISGGQVSDSSRSYADFRAPQMTRPTPQAQLPKIVEQRDATADLLGKIAGARFAEKIQEAQQEAFVQGAARAASGEAMAEIASTAPWYQSIFGDTAVVEGARAYTIKAGVAKWTGEHIAQMDKLAEQAPADVPAYLSKSMQKYMTGDAATDSAMQAELLSQIPPLVKEHTKQHYMLQQKRADLAATQAIGNSLALFEQYANGTLDVEPEGAANIMAGIEQALAPQPGMNPEAHYNRVSKSILQAAQDGSFKTIGALGGLGYIDKLSPEDQLEVDRALRKAAPAKLRGSAIMLGGELRELFRNPPLLDEVRDQMVDEINSRAQDISGVPAEYGTLLDLQDRLRLDSAADSELARGAREAQAAAKQAKTEEQKQSEALMLEMAVASGDPQYISNVKDLLKIPESDVQNEFRKQLGALPVEEQAKRAAGSLTPINFIEAAVQAERTNILFSDNPDPVQVDAAVKRYQELRKAGAHKVYYKDEMYSQFIDELSRKDYRGDNLESAIRVTRTLVSQRTRYGVKPTEAVREGVTGVLDDTFRTGFLGRVGEALGSTVGAQHTAQANVNSRTMQHLEAVVGGAVASSLDNGEPAQQARAEIKSLLASGDITQVGRNVIINERPEQTRGPNSLPQLLGIDQVAANTLVDLKITGLVEQHGIDADSYLVLRMGGEGDATEFLILGKDGEGREAGTTFTVSDLKLDVVNLKSTMRSLEQARQLQPVQEVDPQGNRERGGMTENERNILRGR